jgi:acetyl-CoA carboxylase carboxyl transferase subunit alpha
MPTNALEFDKPIAEIEARIEELKRISQIEGVDRSEEIAQLESDVQQLLQRIFKKLTPWDKVLLARHPKRPYTMDYIERIFADFLELHGDRLGHDDQAMVGGLARLGKQYMIVVGQQKGRDLAARRSRNFGSAKPEGYRKALRLMRLAAKFHLPIICFVDTPAADCSVEAEERGICESIARNMMEMFELPTPIVVVVLGEGGSGGAIGIGIGDRVIMLEHSIYSVIPPEGCAAILWRDPARGDDAARALRLTAQDALELGVCDEIVPEPLGGANRDYDAIADAVKAAIQKSVRELSRLSEATLLERRYQKFRAMGVYAELASVADPALDPNGRRAAAR